MASASKALLLTNRDLFSRAKLAGSAGRPIRSMEGGCDPSDLVSSENSSERNDAKDCCCSACLRVFVLGRFLDMVRAEPISAAAGWARHGVRWSFRRPRKRGAFSDALSTHASSPMLHLARSSSNSTTPSRTHQGDASRRASRVIFEYISVCRAGVSEENSRG